MPASKKSNKRTVTDPILGEIEVKYRTDSEIDDGRIARVRALLARAPEGSKLAQIYTVQLNGLTRGRRA